MRISERKEGRQGDEFVRVAITGGTGMIGTALAEALRQRGDVVRVLTRGQPKQPDEVRWDPVKGITDLSKLQGIDAVVNLTGAPIADRPWTKARRQVLWDSRIAATQVLLESFAKLETPPSIFVGVGGLGRFGDRGDVILDDDAEPGTGFLAELALAWEQAHLGANALGCRTSVLRMNLVLSATGGAFPLMVQPFRIGIGGWLGNGRQYTPWITLRDAVAGFLHLLDHRECSGMFNGTVPEPTPNYDWCKALGRALHRPVLTHAPKWALRGALGELADGIFLSSVRAIPAKLTATGFVFQDTEAEASFVRLLAELAQIKR